MDLKGAIGFKRHIQVLNYMLSNWPSTPVAYTHLVTVDTIASPPSHDADDYDEVSEAVVVPTTAVPNHLRNSASSSSLKRVSLTRRVSRMIVDEGGGEEGDVEWKEQEVTLVVTNQDLVTSSTILTSLVGFPLSPSLRKTHFELEFERSCFVSRETGQHCRERRVCGTLRGSVMLP